MASEKKANEESAVPSPAGEKIESGTEHMRKAAEDFKSVAGAFAGEYRGKAEEAWNDASERSFVATLEAFRLIQIFQPFSILFQNARGLAEDGTFHLSTRYDETTKCGHEMEQRQPQRHPNPVDPEQMRQFDDHENNQEDVAENRENGRGDETRHQRQEVARRCF